MMTEAERLAEQRTWSPERRKKRAWLLRALRKARQIEAETGELPSSVMIDGRGVSFLW